jgi:biopolymer transport protein TolR
MTMSLGGGRVRMMSAINVTPMADIMIVLLIIFMVTVPLMGQGRVAALPRAPHAGDRRDGPLVLAMPSNGSVRLDDQPIQGGAALRMALEQRFEAVPSGARLVIVEADEELPFEAVGAALRDCREAGADEVALATHPYR